MPMTVASDLHDHAEAETHGPGRATTGDVFRLLALAAMTAVLIGLRVPGIVIKDPGCVAKTYPGFWEDFEKLRQS